MFKLEIDNDNAAFEYPSELPRMIREVARKVEEGHMSGTVKDINGNTCGKWHL
jgi:hypothetical protein